VHCATSVGPIAKTGGSTESGVDKATASAAPKGSESLWSLGFAKVEPPGGNTGAPSTKSQDILNMGG
jgi:hypothetical protein